MGAQMKDPQLVETFGRGHAGVMEHLYRISDPGASIFDLLHEDHVAVMERLNQLCGAGTADEAQLRSAFAEVQAMLMAHALAEERVLYSKLKLNPKTQQLALESATDHEMVTRLCEDLSGLGLTAEQRSTMMTALRDLVQQHVETEEGEVFEQARAAFDRAELDEMACAMQVEKLRLLRIAA